MHILYERCAFVDGPGHHRGGVGAGRGPDGLERSSAPYALESAAERWKGASMITMP